MVTLSHDEETLIEKIRGLPPEKAVEVEDFVDFLRRRDQYQTLTTAAAMLSEPAFHSIWDNLEDAIYDQL